MFDTSRSVLQPIDHPMLKQYGIRLEVKRDDLIHSEVSGNKWRKLKYNIEACHERGLRGVRTYGGAYSNHLLATAAACHEAGLECQGVVRGEELSPMSNATLKRCAELGMELSFIPRGEYRQRTQVVSAPEEDGYWVVPEGGANREGLMGCVEVMQEVSGDRIVVAQGTTTTSCGLYRGLSADQRLTVVPALKGFDSLGEMAGLLGGRAECLRAQVEVLGDYHFGGYAKQTPELLSFIRDWNQEYQLPLDPVYTGKAFFALWDRLASYEGEHIVFLHTGGLRAGQIWSE